MSDMQEFLQTQKVAVLKRLCTVYDIVGKQKKKELVQALLVANLEIDELVEQLEEWDCEEKTIQNEAQKQIDDERIKIAEEQRKLEMKLQLANIELERQKLISNSENQVINQNDGSINRSYDMTKYIQPFKDGGDLGLFLVNFERVNTQLGYLKDTWSLRLMTVLPPNAAEVIARLPENEASDYDSAKSSLLKKYKLSADTYRCKFRSKRKGRDESYAEHAYSIKANFSEWIKAEKANENLERLIQLLCLEQFYSSLPGEMKFWVEDKNVEKTVEKAAELADEYQAKRWSRPEGHKEMSNHVKSQHENKSFKWQNHRDKTKETQGDNPANFPIEKTTSAAIENKTKFRENKFFEKRKPLRCYNCNGPHYAYQCDKPKIVFACINTESKTFDLLQPYMMSAEINGKEGNILRDSAATYDVVSENWITSKDYTGKTVYLRMALSDESVCLPVANVKIKGSFGELTTEAAVTKKLPDGIPFLLSNRGWKKIEENNANPEHEMSMMLTRSKARKLLALEQVNRSDDSIVVANETLPKSIMESTIKTDEKQVNPNSNADITEISEQITGTMNNELEEKVNAFNAVLKVSPTELIASQKQDESLKPYLKAAETHQRMNGDSNYYCKQGILYRNWCSKEGVQYDQLVLPSSLRPLVLRVSHNNAWAGHMGAKKTLRRLRQEFWWPKQMMDVKIHVKCCDVCMRVGKTNDKGKQPLRPIPVITEPYKRIIVDVVGPLPLTTSGNKYLLTTMCSATRFTEAVPLKIANSESIVEALLNIFARVGFPSEMQSDQGSVFTSALTTTFLEGSGIKMIHSSVYHPQSNSVERFHGTLKRILRALCYESKDDWDKCLPAALFAIRSAPHESTGFSPAELLYGRQIRGPLAIIREKWEGTGEHITVVEYVINLLERFHRIRNVAEINVTKAQNKAKLYYDRTSTPREFKEGDRVLVLRPMRKNKLSVHWDGPEVVLKKLSHTNYLTQSLQKKNKGKQNLLHINLLKPYFEESQFTALTLLPMGSEEDDIEIPQLEHVAEPKDGLSILHESPTTEKLSESQKMQLQDIISEFSDVFSDVPGSTNLIEHDIVLTEDKIIRAKAYHQSPKIKGIINEEIDKMLDLGKIKHSDSPFASPMIIVHSEGKEPRPVVDYRNLNKITVPKNYPIPNIEKCVEKVSQAKFVTTFDLVRGYWQVPMTEKARQYAAFITHRGVFEPLYMSFGLQGASFTFQKLMDQVLFGLEEFAIPYQDDIAIFSETWEEHLKHVEIVLKRLRQACLTLKARKCNWGQAVVFLGHVIGGTCRRPADAKVAAIQGFQRPVTKRDVRAFLGLTGYYNHYVSNYANIASPLTDALKKNCPNKIAWNNDMENAFSKLKLELIKDNILRAPDYSREFIVQVDCSKRGMGVTLSQINEELEEHPILYLSKKLTLREQAYGASELECACLVWAIAKLRPYLYGAHFFVETDHNPLRWLNQVSSKNDRLLRWSLSLQPHNFTIRYKRGSLNRNVDGLSRYFV